VLQRQTAHCWLKSRLIASRAIAHFNLELNIFCLGHFHYPKFQIALRYELRKLRTLPRKSHETAEIRKRHGSESFTPAMDRLLGYAVFVGCCHDGHRLGTEQGRNYLFLV